ncbi:MAG TPA: penicillin acylase family protein [Blastocatellia bacterium]|nr:penicillin acylase family protein [Blastocatellia bacterium]
MPKSMILFVALGLLLIPTAIFSSLLAHESVGTAVESLSGLRQPVTVARDRHGVPHITGSSDYDVNLMLGYLHAQDRFFQMDALRRQGAGRLAEMLGAGPNDQILESDTLIRMFGIGRSAERSLTAYTPESAALLQAYADGVNAWLDSHSLPPEYAALEITQVPRWSPVDSLAIVKLNSFQLSFETEDLQRTLALLSYQAAGQSDGFDGTKLFFDDIFRFAPFDPAVTIAGSVDSVSPGAREIRSPDNRSIMIEQARRAPATISPQVRETARKFLERYERNPLLNRSKQGVGSNWWIVAGSKTETGHAMLANDPHLGLGIPTIFYEVHLTVDSRSAPLNVYGAGYAGVPGVFLGQNERIAWGATTASLDITDLFIESLAVENGEPVGTLYRGGIEPLIRVPEEFKVNQVQNGVADDLIPVSPGERPSGLNVPSATMIVPRRNNGPLFVGGRVDAISVQFAGSSPTRDLEGIWALARARNISDFKRGLQLLEVGSLNWAYADVDGNIATFVNGQIPLREDLEAGTIEGLPPFFLRDGTGTARNEWIPRSDPGPGFNYESLPPEEMPQAVNPAQGFLVNANNDPLGITFDNNPIDQRRSGGLYYISSGFSPGFRAAKITSLLNQYFNNNRGRGRVKFQDLERIQSNVQLFDAEVFTPYLVSAFDTARRTGAPADLAALAGDPAVRAAVERLSKWDFSAPTGIPEGYDFSDHNGLRQRPSHTEISNSVAATIYTVWRSRILNNTIIATLRRFGLESMQPYGDREVADLRFLLDNFSTNQGVGASGLDFFETTEIDAPPPVRRDYIILKSLKEALNLLAGDEFSEAFNRSTDQNDYRWGKLHRITFSHLFGGLAPQFSIPTAGNFEDLSPALPGLAADGGFETIDLGPIEVRAASSQAYTFGVGSARRYVGELCRYGIKSAEIIPGGESGVIGGRFYADQLSLWLTNDYHRVLFSPDEIARDLYSSVIYKPSN